MTIDRFLRFQHDLQTEILWLEFTRKSPDDSGRISERQFAELLLAYANYSAKKRTAVLNRVKKTYKKGAVAKVECSGISLEDYTRVFNLLMYIEDVERALYFHFLAGASIDRETLKHVAKVCADIELGDHLVDVIFTVFDDDKSGGLSHKEFIAVMRNKLKRGLEKSKDTGLFDVMSALAKCAVHNAKRDNVNSAWTRGRDRSRL